MGNGEVERATTLAKRDLASAGITDPTPKQLEAALMGGTVVNAQGDSTTMDGVLQLRSQGMGWGNIAHTIGEHPAQSEQGAANSRRGGGNASIAGAGVRNERPGQVLSRDDGRNHIGQDTRAIAKGSTTSVNASDPDRDNGRKQAAQDRRFATAGSSLAASARGRGNDRSVAAAAGAVGAEGRLSGLLNTSSGATRGDQTADRGRNGPVASARGNARAAAGADMNPGGQPGVVDGSGRGQDGKGIGKGGKVK